MPQLLEPEPLSALAEVRDLFASERAWLAARAERGAGGTRIWIARDPEIVPDPAWIALAASAPGKIAGPVTAERAALPFLDGSVARLVVQHGLEDEAVPTAFLGECVRVLAPGGELVLFSFDPMSLWHPWLLAQARRRHEVLRLRLGSRLMALVRRLGLSDVEFHAIGPRWPGGRRGEGAPASGGSLRGAYAICAIKRVASVIVLRPRAVPEAMSANGMLPASQRVGASA
jgi:hypothetical protein